MRELTKEEIEELEYFAGLLFSDQILAEILELPSADFCLQMKMKEGDIYRTVNAARIKAEAVIRKGIIDMAGRGSTPAQTQAAQLLAELRKDNA